ncbi:MAG: cytochrome c oxidase subunit II [Planctomycetaceae bacterium]|nr:cytochrome c oxidase subunit II [Planctomycetaceae bacterium]
MQDSFFFPVPNSTFAPTVDGLFYLILGISAFFFIAIMGLMVFFMIKYRRIDGVEPESSPGHNTALELTWSIIPVLIVIGIFGWGFTGYVDMRSPPDDAYEINVTASTWAWDFRYSTGAPSKELHIPVNTPVKLIMQSQDVLHSLFVPAFRVKQDVVPGRYSGLWFQAKEPGSFDLFCAEYCGKQHSDMITKVIVHNTDPANTNLNDNPNFETWLADASDPIKDNEPLYESGKRITEILACTQCHTADGSKKVGPSFKGTFGTQQKLSNGKMITVDENYIRQSILDPTSQIRDGFKTPMPSFKGRIKDEWIDAVIAYFKHLKKE